jgi:hypothetical protein
VPPVSGHGRCPRCRELVFAIVLQALAWPVAAHDWYKELRDQNGSPCCSGCECKTVNYRYNTTTGHLEVDLDGMWTEVHPSKIVPSSSIDNNVHACFETQRYRPYRVLRCVILPGEV